MNRKKVINIFTFNKQQRYIIEEAKKSYHSSSEQLFQFTGGPGTGKSVVLNAIIEELGLDINEVAPMAYTGAAAIVMRTKGLINAKTEHSSLYNPVEIYKYDDNGNIAMDTYLNRPRYTLGFEPKDLTGIKLIVVDEAAQTPYEIREEILSRGIKTIAAGDLDQLPPITSRPGFLCEGTVYRLTEFMRQSLGSSILYLADRAIKELPIHEGVYNNSIVINEDELTDNMILNSDIVICGKNKTRDKFNNHVRQDIFRIGTDLPTYNERMICRKNNWNLEVEGINLANGLLGTIQNQPDVSGFDGKTYKINFHPTMIESYFKDLACDYQYLTAPRELKEKLKNNRYNKGEKMEFAYAITTHLSQGNEFNNGIYFSEYLNKDIQKNLNYTGITRFKNWMIYVKPKRKWYY